MSGPKGYAYEVVSPEELARRALREAVNRCTNLEVRLAAINQMLTRDGEPSVEVRDANARSIEQAQRLEQELQRAIASAEVRLQEAVRRKALRSMPTALAPVLGESFAEMFRDAAETASASNRSTPTGDEEVQAEGRAAVDERLGKVLSSAATLTDSGERDRLVALAEQIQQSPVEKAWPRRHELVVQVNAMVRDQRNRQAVRNQAELLLLGFETDDPEAERLRARAATIATGEALENLKQAAAELKRRRAVEAEDAFVARTAAEVLSEMGYRVEQLEAGERTVESTLIASRQDLSAHALQVRLLPENGLMLTRIVATEDTDVAQGVRAEEATCGDSAVLAQRMSERGIKARRVHAQPVGAVPVEYLSGERVEAQRTAAERRTAERRTAAQPQARRKKPQRAAEGPAA